MNLIDALRAKQGMMSQADFAGLLGISEAALSLIYAGERQIGESVGRRIVRVYPDLRWLVTGYIMDKEEAKEVRHSKDRELPRIA